MEVFDRIPVLPDSAIIVERLRLGPGRAGPEGADKLIGLARSLVCPRAAVEAASVGARSEATIEVAGITFESPVLRKNLEKADKAFPYVITLGPDLERAASAQADLLMQFYLEEIANVALEQAAGWLARRLEEVYGFRPLSSLSPGSLEDWPITEQTKLFSILGDTQRLIGVRLTDSMLMVPRKSISGILFPSEEGFVACQLCDRANCQGRKAPYKAKSG